MRQDWRDVVFIHWPCDPDELARRLPPGLTLDTHDGVAWVALSSFQVAACGLGPFPPPSLWRFPETNLRTYVVGPDGRDGLWFLSIEAATLPLTIGARVGIGAPYHHADMVVRRDGPEVRYRSRRHGAADVAHDIRIRIGAPLTDPERTGFVDWCTGRWRSWTTQAGLYLASPVEHQPWPLHHAELLALDETITAAAELPPPAGEPLVHYSPGVDARFAPTRPHRPRTAGQRTS
jgi:uncharacterized protein YqjF (DUF2071 family)